MSAGGAHLVSAVPQVGPGVEELHLQPLVLLPQQLLLLLLEQGQLLAGQLLGLLEAPRVGQLQDLDLGKGREGRGPVRSGPVSGH